MALMLLGCTDRRQEEAYYLNLLSWQACDDQWLYGQVPLAASSAFIYCLLLPFVLVWCLTRHKEWQPFINCFTLSYDDRMRWWELIVVMRRLALIAVVTLVP